MSNRLSQLTAIATAGFVAGALITGVLSGRPEAQAQSNPPESCIKGDGLYTIAAPPSEIRVRRILKNGWIEIKTKGQKKSKGCIHSATGTYWRRLN